MGSAGFGAFGKMPSVGDFFRMNAPPGFVQAWDDWLQRGLLQGAETLGDRWDAHYMSAPIWRFCLSGGLAGPSGVLGVIMPSVDRVGRRFPLTLMAPLEDGEEALLAHFLESELFQQAEDLALAALEDDMTRDRLAESLEGLPTPSLHLGASVQSSGQSLTLSGYREGGSFLPDLATSFLDDRYQNPSIFSTEIDGVPRLMICEGLPTGAHRHGLFDLTSHIWKEAALT